MLLCALFVRQALLYDLRTNYKCTLVALSSWKYYNLNLSHIEDEELNYRYAKKCNENHEHILSSDWNNCTHKHAYTYCLRVINVYFTNRSSYTDIYTDNLTSYRIRYLKWNKLWWAVCYNECLSIHSVILLEETLFFLNETTNSSL